MIRTSASCSSSSVVKRVRSRFAIRASKPRRALGLPKAAVKIVTSTRWRSRSTPRVDS
jgi:hypothetical protein